MKTPLELKALAWAVLAGVSALGSALLLASPLERVSAGAAPAPVARMEPAPNPTLLAQGEKDFGVTCADCHGDDAHGDEGPDLHNLTISNARISTTIRNGVKGEMPSFRKKYGDADVAALVAYLRSLH